MATNSLWLEEAQKLAANKKNEVKAEQQYLIDQANANKAAALQSLENNNLSTINKLNEGKTTVEQTAADNARQANINRLMSLRDNKYALNRAGLGSTGIVGSQVNSINNNYGTSLNDILKNKANSLQNIENQVNDTNLQYATNKISVGNEYDSNIANIKAQIEEKALNEYNTLVDRYLAQKQQEYANQQAELNRIEQQKQAAISNAQTWAQINANKNAYLFNESDNESQNNNQTSAVETRPYNQIMKDTITSYVSAPRGQSELLKNKYVDLIEKALQTGKISNSEALEMLKTLGINTSNNGNVAKYNIVNNNDLMKSNQKYSNSLVR